MYIYVDIHVRAISIYFENIVLFIFTVGRINKSMYYDDEGPRQALEIDLKLHACWL